MQAYADVIQLHLTVAFWFGLVPLIAVAFAVTFPILFTRNGILIGVAFGFSIIGASIGLMMGSSREPAVAAILPGLLTLLTGAVAFLMPKEVLRAMDAIGIRGQSASRLPYVAVMVAICCMAGAMVFSANFGASVREANEVSAEQRARARLIFEQIELPYERDQIRQHTGMPIMPVGE